MSGSFNIRLATASDAGAITAFNIAMAKETENKTLDLPTVNSGVSRLLASPQYGFYVVAEGHGQIIGSLMVTYEWTDWRDGLFWWIQSVYVKPEFRGRGVYKKLHGFVRDTAKRDPEVHGIRLYVEKENSKAQRAYQKEGMTESYYRIYEELFESK